MKKILIAAAMLLITPSLQAQYVVHTDKASSSPAISCFYSDQTGGSFSNITGIRISESLSLKTMQPITATTKRVIISVQRNPDNPGNYKPEEVIICSATSLSEGEKYGLRICNPDGKNQWLHLLPDDVKVKLYEILNCITPIVYRDDSLDYEKIG